MSDRIFHQAFKKNANYFKLPIKIKCRNCGTLLKVYYAEERLYAVKCVYCESVALVKASCPAEAARYVGEAEE